MKIRLIIIFYAHSSLEFDAKSVNAVSILTKHLQKKKINILTNDF